MDKFSIEEHGEVSLIKVQIPRATLEYAEEFKLFVSNLIQKDKKKIVIDLTMVQFLDSTFLGAIVINLKRAATSGGDVRLVACDCEDTVVWSMFEATRMNKVFRVFDNLETAVKSYD